MRISREKSERVVGIAPVLSQMKRHATEQMPNRVDRAQPCRRPFGMLRGLGGDEFPQLAPQSSQHVGAEVLQPAHRRGFGDKLSQSIGRRLRDGFPLLQRSFSQMTNGLEEFPRKPRQKAAAADNSWSYSCEASRSSPSALDCEKAAASRAAAAIVPAVSARSSSVTSATCKSPNGVIVISMNNRIQQSRAYDKRKRAFVTRHHYATTSPRLSGILTRHVPRLASRPNGDGQ